MCVRSTALILERQRVLASFCSGACFSCLVECEDQDPEGMHKVCRALTAVKEKNDFESVSKTEPLLNGMCP